MTGASVIFWLAVPRDWSTGKAWPLSVHLLFHRYRVPHTKWKPSTHVNTMAAFGCFQFGLCLCSYLPFPSIQTYFRLLVVLLFLFCLNPRPFVLSLTYTMTFQGKSLHSCILYQIHGKLWLQQGVGGDSLQVTAMDILHGVKKMSIGETMGSLPSCWESPVSKGTLTTVKKGWNSEKSCTMSTPSPLLQSLAPSPPFLLCVRVLFCSSLDSFFPVLTSSFHGL